MTHASFSPDSRILVVRRDNIGDLICTTPALSALRRRYPNAKIAALVNSYNAEVIKNNVNLDHVFVYKKIKHVPGLFGRFKAILERLALIVRLRFWRPDVAILAKSCYEKHGLNFVRLIGAKCVIGYEPQDPVRVKKMPDIQIPIPKFEYLHEVEAVNRLLAPLGICDALGPLEVSLDRQALSRVKQMIPDASVRIALHISAREIERRWGVDNFVDLINDILTNNRHVQVLLLWAPGGLDNVKHPGGDEDAEQIIKAVKNERLVPVETHGLQELVAVISLCEIFIGADGGAMHVAAACNKKILALFEALPNKLKCWYPWQVTHRIVCSQRQGSPEVSHISLRQVLVALRELSF